MAPLFQRRSVIRNDDTDYSVRARYSHNTHDAGLSIAPPPVRIYSPPPPPIEPSTPPPAPVPSRLKIGLEGLTGHARGITRQLADASRSKIATIAGRLAKTLSDTEPPLVAFAAAPSRETAMPSEERRWHEYEAAHRIDSPDPVSDASNDAENDPPPADSAADAASEILRVRAERILTEAERLDVEQPPVDDSSPPDTAAHFAPTADIPILVERGKYGMLMDQVGDRTPQNWDTTPEEPPMQEEHTNGTHMEARTRSVKLDSDSNTIDITRESRFSGQLKFSGTLIVEGEVEGELEATRIIIREGGTASARILGDSITIAGKVHGDVIARRALEITSTGKLQGDACAAEMKLQPGASFKGSCAIGEAK